MSKYWIGSVFGGCLKSWTVWFLDIYCRLLDWSTIGWILWSYLWKASNSSKWIKQHRQIYPLSQRSKQNINQLAILGQIIISKKWFKKILESFCYSVLKLNQIGLYDFFFDIKMLNLVKISCIILYFGVIVENLYNFK